MVFALEAALSFSFPKPQSSKMGCATLHPFAMADYALNKSFRLFLCFLFFSILVLDLALVMSSR
jgi:hypothetical protein